jgi:hypothetical protein
MVRDEETPADYLESRLDAIALLGLPNHLAQRVDAGAARS